MGQAEGYLFGGGKGERPDRAHAGESEKGAREGDQPTDTPERTGGD